jgi:predicted ATPase/DNA-binding SARP family transcriptional activator/Tfp pilus assembly protein PilF
MLLILKFLGLPQVSLDAQPVATDRRKALALLAYLAVNDVGRPRQKYSRESLSALLWPDFEQARAFSNLRTTLWELRQAIGEDWLIAERESVQLNPNAEIDLDVADFRDLLSQSRQQNDPALRIPLLSDAVKLYRDHFLTGFSLKDAPNFNEWAFAESENLRRKLAEALTTLSEDHSALGQVDQAIPYARRLIALDPLNESSHRQLMEVYWQAGQHSAALKQYQTCEQSLRKELNLDPQPETRALYKKILKGDVKPIQIEKQTGTVVLRNNLPLQLSTFIGREKELIEITNLVVNNRLVTLTGAGGIGKTRLSIQVGFALLNDFPNGTWLVELAPLSDPTLVPQAIVTTLGLIEQAGRPPLMILTDFLQDKHALLILDNCEHLIQACAQLAETLLSACPDLHVLATSREALSIAGEAIYLVPSLTTPDTSHTDVDTLLQYEAVQLFVERAQSAKRDFSLDQENAYAIAQICYQLDGIPLALELAAARVKLLRVEEIAARLHDRFRFLTGGARTALPRHQTLQAMIDWSYDLLSESERALLRRLSVFAGGWSLEGAESVCAGKGIAVHEILDLLTQLLNKSLILAERQQGEETRYRMLETVRQYARGKLWEAGEGEIMRQRHLAYFVDLAERAEPNLRAFDMVIWLDRLEAELDNTRTALGWAIESDVEAELRLTSTILWFWHIRGHKNEGIDWLERGLAIEAAERSDQPLKPDRALIRGRALSAAGFLRLMLEETDKGAVLSEESLTLFRELGMMGKRDTAYALWNLSAVADQQRDSLREKALLEECLALFRETGDKFGIAQCIDGLGFCAFEEGNHEQARTLLEEHLALRQEIGDKDGIALAFLALGHLALEQGNYKQARTQYEAGLSLFREVGNRSAMSIALSSLGRVARAIGDYGQATTMLEEALVLGQNLGEKSSTARWLNELGLVARSQGDYSRAIQMHEQALGLFREIGNQILASDALCNLGFAALAQADYTRAVEMFEEALSISTESGNHFNTALALYGKGRVAQSQGDFATARELNMDAIAIFRDRCDSDDRPEGMAYCLEVFAILAVAQKQTKRAVFLFSMSESLYTSLRFQMSAKERAEHDQAIATARAALGEEEFAAAYEEGKKMTMHEAIEYALEDKG